MRNFADSCSFVYRTVTEAK